MFSWRSGLTAVLLLMALAGWAQTNLQRVALMDFSTDDNSYRSTRTAADFSSLLQSKLATEPDVEWVERAQLDKARQELELSAAELSASGSAVQRGKWVKADWMIKGQFSQDDKNQRTLFLEITDLRHADTLASQTIVFPGLTASQFQMDTNQLELAAISLHQLLDEARQRQRQTADKILVAPLFMVDVSGFGGFNLSGGKISVGQQFDDLLARAAAANDQVRLVRFSKAYRSTDESEMVLDGLVDTSREAWQQTADLYVWGTYSHTNLFTPGKPRTSRWDISVHLWDGASQPVVLKETMAGNAPPDQIAATLERLAGQIIARAHKSSTTADSGAIRQDVARSLVATYDQMTLEFHHREEVGLHDPEKFLQAAHMLETACFFDPDNANARVLYITCRWGWWMDFRFNVKNQFWSMWRRSQAWGDYVNRFGLKPVTTELPFPYSVNGGIPAMYVESLKGALENFPRWSLEQAERQGFPKGMPPELAQKWQKDLEAELARRQKLVEEFNRSTASPTNPPAKFSAAPPAVPVKPALPPTNGSAARPAVKRPANPQPSPMIATPAWLNRPDQNRNLFHLSPPPALPLLVKPAFREISFPKQFEVQSVRQVDFLRDRLLILASDERSAQSSDDKPDLSAELVDKRNRLWTLAPGTSDPTLFEPGSLPESVTSFCTLDDQLWIAGKNTGYLDLASHTFRKFDLNDGLAFPETGGIGSAGGSIFACSDLLNICRFDPASGRWTKLPQPTGPHSWSGNAYALTGNSRWLCVGQKGSSATLIYDLAAGNWHDTTNRWSAAGVAAAGSGLWLGCGDGLYFYDPASGDRKQWPAPVPIAGPLDIHTMQFLMYSPQISRDQLEAYTNQMLRTIIKFAGGHAGQRPMKAGAKICTDPLHLDYRIPNDITAMVSDGDFLWLASGQRLYLLHMPSASMVACTELPASDTIACLAQDKNFIWAGIAYGGHKLLGIPKDSFTSVPKESWVSLAISPEERTRLIRGSSTRDQAMYAFYAGDYDRVVELLGDTDPGKAGLEEMFLLVFSYDAFGTDKPALMQAWSQHLADRFPDTPWAAAAQTLQAESAKNHQALRREKDLLAKYDTDHNGVLDALEKAAMEKDPAYLREQKGLEAEQLADQLAEIMKHYDRNSDGRLDRMELEMLHAQVRLFSEAPPAMLTGRKILIAPLLTKNFPTVDDILKKYDAKGAGGLDPAGFRALAHDLQK